MGPPFDALVRAIEASITAFRAAEPKLSFRQKHDILRVLWQLAHKDDPPIGVIRGQIERLPNQLLDHIDYRAWRKTESRSGRLSFSHRFPRRSFRGSLRFSGAS